MHGENCPAWWDGVSRARNNCSHKLCMVVLLSSPQWPPQARITDPTRDQSLANAKKEHGGATAPRWLSLSPPGPAWPDHIMAALYHHWGCSEPNTCSSLQSTENFPPELTLVLPDGPCATCWQRDWVHKSKGVEMF